MISIKNLMWKSFIIYSFTLIIFLWLFQGLFFGNYYKFVKTKDAKHIVATITKYQNDDKFEEKIDKLSFDKGVCIDVVDSDLVSHYKSKFVGKGCFIGNEERSNSFKLDFIESKKNEELVTLSNPRFRNNTIVIAKKLDNNKYAFVNTSLQPIDSTVNIIIRQLIIFTFVSIILSILISFMVSKYLSKPLVSLNNESKKLAKGKFDEDIKVDANILEVNELANTLNYTRLELNKTDELRRDLMSNVSHDMKTPLTMIKAYAEMINDLHKEDYEKRMEDANVIIEEADRLTTLVNDILDLSKMQSNISELNIEKFNIIELIDNIIKRFDVLVVNDGYVFEFIHKNKKIYVNADKKKIEQVLYNLITNAINYVGNDKKIIVELINNSDIIEIRVIDHGKGINKEDIPYIWDKYYKSSKKYKRNKFGTGLGLSIVKNILDEHTYDYGVDSIENKGSTFWFKIKK